MKKLHYWLPTLAFALAVCTLAGCHAHHREVTREDLVGSYIYISKDPEDVPTNHNMSRLVLSANGTYDLVQGGTTTPIAEERGHWALEPRNITYGQPPNVFLGHEAYPVEFRGNEVRLMIDYDVGVWWMKIR